MTANTDPLFVVTPVLAIARIASAANTARDGSGTLTSLVVGSTYGTRIDRITVQGTLTTTTAGMIRFFVDNLTIINGIHEIPVTAVTASGSAVAWNTEWVRTDGLPLLVLPSGYILKCASNNAEQFDFAVFGGNF